MSGTTGVAYKSPLHEMTQSTPTCLWNDSASIQELTYSIEHGAVGATCNPVIVLGVLKKEMSLWKDRISSLIAESPTAGEEEIAWRLVREISIKGAGLLKPIFDAQQGRNGRLSIQTDPRLYRDTRAIVEQASEFSQLAPNMIVKIPVVKAGIPAIEEATYHGVSINATVCFTLRSASQLPKQSNVASNGASAKGKTSAPWDRSAPLWLAAWTTGSKF